MLRGRWNERAVLAGEMPGKRRANAGSRDRTAQRRRLENRFKAPGPGRLRSGLWNDVVGVAGEAVWGDALDDLMPFWLSLSCGCYFAIVDFFSWRVRSREAVGVNQGLMDVWEI